MSIEERNRWALRKNGLFLFSVATERRSAADVVSRGGSSWWRVHNNPHCTFLDGILHWGFLWSYSFFSTWPSRPPSLQVSTTFPIYLESLVNSSVYIFAFIGNREYFHLFCSIKSLRSTSICCTIKTHFWIKTIWYFCFWLKNEGIICITKARRNGLVRSPYLNKIEGSLLTK